MLATPRFIHFVEVNNVPPQEGESNKNREVWKKYVDIVSADSVTAGRDFDVAYAIKILSDAIGLNGVPKHSQAESTNDEPDFDEWLAGFNRE